MVIKSQRFWHSAANIMTCPQTSDAILESYILGKKETMGLILSFPILSGHFLNPVEINLNFITVKFSAMYFLEWPSCWMRISLPIFLACFSVCHNSDSFLYLFICEVKHCRVNLSLAFAWDCHLCYTAIVYGCVLRGHRPYWKDKKKSTAGPFL